MDTKNKKQTIDYYLNLPWTYTVEMGKDNDGKKIYIISVNEFPDVQTHAYTAAEAFEIVKEPLEAIIEIYLEQNKPIPEPINEEQFEGNIAYRTTGRRHYLLAKEAQKQGLSLSKMIDELIGKTLNKK